MGLPIFRFYDKDNASAVTITGQDIIKSTGKAINECFKRSLNEKEGDWVIYTDTDSCFASALPIIKKNMPDIDLNDEKAMTEAILKVTGDVQSFVNKFYDVMAKRYFNIEKHRFDAKQEVIQVYEMEFNHVKELNELFQESRKVWAEYMVEVEFDYVIMSSSHTYSEEVKMNLAS